MIDGTAFCYRAFYAIRSLSTADGRPTNAVFGFARMLHTIRAKERPDYLAVAFDVRQPTFRHQRFEAYKEHRKPTPEPLIAQVPLVKSLLAAYRVPVFEQAGYEGEDVLATIARQIAPRGVEVFLVTGDKDALQLITDQTKVYNPYKAPVVLDAEAVKARYGVAPTQMVDLMALMGDATDNIPSVPGIGEKTAAQLLQRFGSLDELYRRLPDLESPARRKTLEAARPQVELSRDLARIDSHVPFDVTLESLAVREPDWAALRTLFRELEFKQLLRELDGTAPRTATRGPKVELVDTARDIESLLRRLSAAAAPVGIDIWTTHAPRGKAETAGTEEQGLAIAVDEQAAWVVPLDGERLKSPPGRKLVEWLSDRATLKVAHDAKTLLRELATRNLALRGIAGDTMLAAYLLNPARTSQPLSDLADEWLDRAVGPRPVLAPPMASALEPPDVREAIGRYATVLLPLHERLLAELSQGQLLSLYTDLELPLLEVLARMEAVGVAVDLPYLASLRSTMDAKRAALAEQIFELAGETFNLNSPKQLARVLFDRLKLPVIKRMKTGPSTDSDVLQQLAARHPLPQQLIQHRELSKLISTYVEALPALVHPSTGRLHTTFNQAATATGRLSSSDPNLQNIPIKTELGRSIRRAFIPGLPDAALLAADYSQIELRILAHLSGDEALTAAFREGRDVHRFTASLIYGLPETEVQPEQRNAMKAINYGILYGMTAHGLSKELGIGYEEAQAFIDAYFERYPRVRGYLDGQIAQARQAGFVHTLLGRRRYVPEVNNPDPVLRQFGERMAINAPIQGTAADLIKRAMVQVDERLRRERLQSRMVLQVHDELVFECPRDERTALAALVREVMEGAIKLAVPLEVIVKAGPNWLDLAPIK